MPRFSSIDIIISFVNAHIKWEKQADISYAEDHKHALIGSNSKHLLFITNAQIFVQFLTHSLSTGSSFSLKHILPLYSTQTFDTTQKVGHLPSFQHSLFSEADL